MEHKNYSDPVWIYLNNLSRVPLLSHGQEMQYAVIIRYAQYKLLDMAFRQPSAFQLIKRIKSLIDREGTSCSDFFRIEKTEEAEKNSHRLIDAILQLEGEIKKASTEEDINKLRDRCVDLVQELKLNPRYVQDIIDEYRSQLMKSSDKPTIDKFLDWEKTRDKAKEAIINANVRLVVSIAKRYIYLGIEIGDLIQEGNRGLITAVDNFDHTKGYRFSTYAIWWIRQAILRSIQEKGKTIHIPANVALLSQKIDHFVKDWFRKNGKNPSVEEISTELGVSVEKVEGALFNLTTVSLDAVINEEDGTPLVECLEDKNTESPFERVSIEDLRTQIMKILNNLEPNERATIMMRLGLDDGRIKTLWEIGERLHLSNERIRQIGIKALRKLRRMPAIKELLPWQEDLDIIKDF